MENSRQLVKLPPITFKNRALRFIWLIVYWIFYRPTPVAFHRWRSLILSLFGARIAAGAHPYPDAKIWAPWNLEMGADSCLGPAVICYNVTKVKIEESAIVSQRTHLCTASHDFNDKTFPLTGASIVIGYNAWVAAEVFIGPGVQVGSRAVIVARSVLVRDVVEGAIMGGNPAKKIGERNLKIIF